MKIKEEELKELERLMTASQAAGPVMIDLSIIRQLIPLLTLFFPALAPLLPLIEKLLDLFNIRYVPVETVEKAVKALEVFAS